MHHTHHHEPRDVASTRHQRTHATTRVQARRHVRSANLGARFRALFFFPPANAWGLAHAHNTQNQNSGSSESMHESHIHVSPVVWRARGTKAHAPQHACKRTDTCARQTWGLVRAHFFFPPPRLGARSRTSKFGFQRTGVRESHTHVSPVMR
jgi:hypothetical protein